MTTEQPEYPALDTLYTDRAHILALLALHYTSYIAYSDADEPDYAVLTLETPHGQMTWHIHARDLELFPHVRRSEPVLAAHAYDGHTTEEKHARIRARIASFAPGSVLTGSSGT